MTPLRITLLLAGLSAPLERVTVGAGYNWKS